MEDNIIFEEIKKKHRNNVENDIPKPLYPKPISGTYWSLYHELREKCNPIEFMTPYNYELVKLSNEIYTLIEENKDDIEELKRIRKRAIEELGVAFSTKILYNELTSMLNPSKYVGDRELVDVSNELYNKVLRNADNIEELEQIKNSQQYKEMFVERERELQQKQVEQDGKVYIGSLIITSIIIMVMILLVYCNK